MSLFGKQDKDFRASMASAASKMAKRPFPPSSGSTILSNSTNRVQKRTPEPPSRKQIYSQPADTGKGEHIQTQVLYARDYLKEKAEERSLDDILSYLSQQNADKPFKHALDTILRKHPQVTYRHDGLGGKGSYKFKPKHDIHNTTDLLAALQKQSTFKGLPVKELKEGWPEAEAGITELEDEHRVLAIRNKKDNTARTVWADDPSLFIHVDAEFRKLWREIKVPAEEQALIDAVVKEGQTPTGKVDKKVKVTGPNKAEKKNKKPRRGGKTTNKHMVGILKDFSHLRR